VARNEADHSLFVVKGAYAMDRVMTRSARLLAVGGIASIVFGITVLLWPGISLLALTGLFGAFAFVYGAFALGAGLTLVAHKSTEWVPFVVSGLGAVLISAVTFLHPAVTELALAYLIGAWALLTGAFEIVAAVDMWGETDGALWFAISGLASIIFGILVAFRPGAGLLTILWVIGIYAIVGGASRLVASYRIHQFHGDVKAVAGAMHPSKV
jgi:uncharacterized membrane protein HdeD (DUF308 family)